MKSLNVILTATLLAACGDITLSPPQSLRTPTNVVVARGDICITTRDLGNGVNSHELNPCDDGAVGLVVNEQSDRVGLFNVTHQFPVLVDLEPEVPGVTHLSVGRLPVDIGVSPDGTAAYVLNQLDRDVSVIDLREPIVLDERIRVDDTPIALEVNSVSGEVIVATGSPSRLRIYEGWTTEASEGSYKFDVGPPADLAGASVTLPGTVTDFKISPDGTTALVSYRDIDRLSVVTFDGQCANPGQSAPCVANEISLTFDCSDGLDNDGDGLVDSQDVQCFGPRGTESPGGIGREAAGPCSNGLDDDNDGLIDRLDPECLRPGMEEDAPEILETPLTACNDGVDSDGDANVDTNDDGCFGPFGRTEATPVARGVDKLSIDSLGVFAYGIDRVNDELIVIDIRSGRIIDTSSATNPTFDGFADTLGVAVTSSPLNVAAFALRIRLFENEDTFRYQFGAWVSNDAGTLQFVETADVYCAFGPNAEISTLDEFYAGEITDQERDCLVVPTLPLNHAARIAAGDTELTDGCETALEDVDPTLLCERTFERNGVETIFNPRFALVDEASTDGRVIGNRECEQPAETVEAMELFARTNASAPQKFKCDSPLMPQPLGLEFFELEDLRNTDELPRATPISRPRVRYTEEGAALSYDVYDQALGNENWTVEYEGVIPGTERDDGLLPVDVQDPYVFETRLAACSRGVQVGDRLTINSVPSGDCEIDAPDDAQFFTFEIAEVRPNELHLQTIEGDDFSQELPNRNCFPTGVTYEIRPVDTWVVAGDDSGFFTSQDSTFDFCETRPGDVSRRNGRVKTGESFVGPYLSFYLYPGFAGEDVPPVRGLSFTFSVERNFSSLRYDTERPFPVGISFAPNLSNGRDMLIAADAEANSIYFKDIRNVSTAPILLR